MDRKDGQETFSVDDTATQIRRDALGDALGWEIETALQAERARIAASLRAKAADHVGITGDVDRVYLRIANQLESGTF